MRVLAAGWQIVIQAGIAVVELVSAIVKRIKRKPREDTPKPPRRHGRLS